MNEVQRAEEIFTLICSNSYSVGEVGQLLEGGVNPCKPTSSGTTILSKAVQLGDRHLIYTIIRALHSHNSHSPPVWWSVDSADECGRSPLHHAVENSLCDVVCMLIGAGANVNIRDSEAITPLHIACGQGSQEITTCLLRAGSDPSVKTSSCYDKVTPIHIAASRNFVSLLQTLLDFGANPNEMDGKGESPLYLAVIKGHYDAAAVLLKFKAEPNFMSFSGKSPLAQAVLQDNLRLTELILGNGGRCHCSQYLLHHAIREGSTDLAKLLITSGFSPSLSDANGDYPLQVACVVKSLELAQLLLENGADANKGNFNSGSFPIYALVASCRDDPILFFKFVSLLQQFGADVNRQTIGGETAFRRAVIGKQVGLAKVLVAVGCDFAHSCNGLSDFNMVRLLLSDPQYGGQDLWSFLSLAGMEPLNIAALLNRYGPFGPVDTEVNAKVVRLVTQVQNRPKTLGELCRIDLRKSLTDHKSSGKNLHSRVDLLLLPETVKQFLKMIYIHP